MRMLRLFVGHWRTAVFLLIVTVNLYARTRVENSFVETIPCTVYVDDDFLGTEPGFGVTKFNAIQPAINMVCPGGVVYVYPGNYYGGYGFTGYIPTDSSNIEIWKPLTLEGYQISGSRDVEIQSMAIAPYDYSSDSGVTIVKVIADSNVTIRNIYIHGHVNPPLPPPPPDTFEMAKIGIFADSVKNFSVSNLVMDSCVFGIWTYKGRDAQFISDSLIKCGLDEARGAGLYFEETEDVEVSACVLLELRPSMPFLKPKGIVFHEGAYGEVGYCRVKGVAQQGVVPIYVGIESDNNLGKIWIHDTNLEDVVNGVILNTLRDSFVMERCTVSLFSGSTGNGISYFGNSLSNLIAPQFKGNYISGNGTGSYGTWGIWLTNNRGYWGFDPNPLIAAFVDSNEILGFAYGIYVDAYKSMSVTPQFDISMVSNSIHDNLYDGVFLADSGHFLWGYSSTAPQGVLISRNSFHDNGELGIDLESFGEPLPGVTLNDTPYMLDPDSGPNSLYNFPVLLGVVNLGGTTWQVSGYAHPGDLVEIYLSDGDPSGYGEGKEYLGNVYAGPTGSFVAFVSTNEPSPTFTAVAIDSQGNTSEFAMNQTGPTSFSEIGDYVPGFVGLYIVENPVKNSAQIEFSVDSKSWISLKVYDVSGKLIRDLFKGRVNRGHYSCSWNLNDNQGFPVGRGVYFVRLKTGNGSLTRKILVLR